MGRMVKLASLALLVGCLPVNANPCGVSCLEEKALRGDAESARDLASRFIKTPSANYFWTVIAAENGDVISQYNLGIDLIEYPKNRFDVERGFFWMCRAAATFQRAEHYLKAQAALRKTSGCS